MLIDRGRTQNTLWLESNKTKNLGKLMCEDKVLRAFFLEKFPDCFINKNIQLYVDFRDESLDNASTLTDRVSEKIVGVENEKKTAKEIIKIVQSHLMEKMKPPQVYLFCPKKFKPSTAAFINQQQEISQMCARILWTSSKMIEAGFNIEKLINHEILKKEDSIYSCKDCKKLSFLECSCKKKEIYPIYSFDLKTWNAWTRQPEIFLEAMCSHVLTTNFQGIYLGHLFCDSKHKEHPRELEFVSRDKRKVVLCSKSRSISNEKKQINLCLKENAHLIFISTRKELPLEQGVHFIGNMKNQENFSEKLTKAFGS